MQKVTMRMLGCLVVSLLCNAVLVHAMVEDESPGIVMRASGSDVVPSSAVASRNVAWKGKGTAMQKLTEGGDCEGGRLIINGGQAWSKTTIVGSKGIATVFVALSPDLALREAVNKGNVALVQGLTAGNPDRANMVVNGEPILTEAVIWGSVKVIKVLIDARANVNGTDTAGSGNTALHKAASMGYPLVVKCLLENKADVNARGKDGSTPLSVAATPGIRRTLIDAGADDGTVRCCEKVGSRVRCAVRDVSNTIGQDGVAGIGLVVAACLAFAQ